ncbi:hypothetical protein FQN55_008073 [Onygenales sp. PD_40]|nr:hypothetical protein FQN55_008073 [Onygenales sp. PD_40]
MAAQAPSDNGRGDQPTNQDGDLASILSLRQRQGLALLLVDIMEDMQQTICDHFDQNDAKPIPPVAGDSSEEYDPNTFEQTRPPPPARKPSTADVKAEAESLRYFGTWKDAVILRIGEIINTPDSAPANQSQEEPPESEVSEELLSPTTSARSFRKSTSLVSRYPPVETPLYRLPTATKLIILHSILLLLLSLEHYSAHSRVLLLRMTSSLGLSVDDLDDDEVKVAKGLLSTAKAMTAEQEAQAKVEGSKLTRKWKIGLASVAGGVLIGVTGGLAAPFVAAGIGAVMGGLGLGATVAAGYLGAVASSAAIIGGIFGAYGARMTGRMMERYAKEVEDFAFIPLHATTVSEKNGTSTVSTEQRLRVTIAISGWLTEAEDFINPWRVLGSDSEVFALRWEFKALVKLGNGLRTIVRNTAWAFASKQAITGTVFAPIIGAVMWPVALLKLSHIVDNPFSIAKIRADKAGQILADALINRAQGERPVTLIGYSLGARVIFSCLNSLAKRRAFGLIESAILIGSPTPSSTGHWRMMRTVVSGRLVNVYSLNDSILGFLYRANSAQFGISGLQPISGVPGVENFDVSDSIRGHLRYQYMIGSILNRIGFDHLDKDQLRRQVDILKAKDEGDEKRLEYEKEQAKISFENRSNANDLPEPSDAEVLRLEREVERQTEEALLHARLGRIEIVDQSQ